jgi:hypothetical protein
MDGIVWLSEQGDLIEVLPLTSSGLSRGPQDEMASGGNANLVRPERP